MANIKNSRKNVVFVIQVLNHFFSGLHFIFKLWIQQLANLL